MRVLLIAGGWSDERQVSLNGAKQINNALKSLGHEVLFFDLTPDFTDLIEAAKKCDAAFINLHGCPGEDGTIQALLNDAGLPYQGSDIVGSCIAINKNLSKQIYKNHGMPTPKWTMITRTDRLPRINLDYPYIAKPNYGGSSLGLSIINNDQEYENYFTALPEHFNEVLCEAFINGIELTCAVLDNQALPPILIKPRKSTYFDYASKYDHDGAHEICPAPIDDVVSKKICALALQAHEVLKLKHYSRTDFMCDKNGNIFILETNTLPGMTATSLVPKAALAAGLEFEDLIDRLLFLTISDKNSNTKKT
ncbi:D-alanine--D-alanine ligase family protein [Desulfonatronovibrio magnus]|uniref:D-alanine--D-alanine ligase family protein n=1 Tax=Desulfonatronovibrio magnus TaxID=698827 RepID=UPI0005EB0E9E|nr:D-alanine--D-alanine ligase [Desulfonatronovibrio magnus]